MSNPKKEVGSIKTIILLGETGAGKSSVVNMLASPGFKGLAKVDNTAQGVTRHSDCYDRQIDDKTYRIYDTVGLGESAAGTMDGAKAIAALYHLMRTTAGGVNLLVYVVRGPRITAHHETTYKMFHDIFCEKEVPIILLLTHMDDVLNKPGAEAAWWSANGDTLDNKGMTFKKRACVMTSTDSTGQYHAASRKIVRDHIQSACLREPWVYEGRASWRLTQVLTKLYNQVASVFNRSSILVLNKVIYEALQQDKDLDDGQRRSLANFIEKEVNAESKRTKSLRKTRSRESYLPVRHTRY
ncbi:P-loop containing nucleoside triphosphate hydrolase protein [Lyophyllum atratum]|nr:P-loop containing nucleoside triphosphate hydrolase protein [Lyophyllum atratum]